MYQPPWEYIIYAEYLVGTPAKLFSPKNTDKFHRLQFPQGFYEMRHLMAGKAKPNDKRKFDSALQWANITLTDEDFLGIEGWNMGDGEVLAGLMELAATGHSVTIKASPDGSGFTAFALGLGDKCPNAGMGLSGYASDPKDAALSLLYKHFVKSAGEWPRSNPTQGRRFR